MARVAGIMVTQLLTDSKLIVGHIIGEYEAINESMVKYLNKVKLLLGTFEKWEVEHIPRSRNVK
jgi:hypothetical protein